MKMRPFKREIREKKGIALIMALWIMTILLVVAASFAFMMRTEVKMAGNYRNGVKAHYLALAGVDHAIAMLLDDSGDVDHLGEAWFTTFATSFSFGDGTYTVDLSDENSKLNLNYANAVGTMHLVDTDATDSVYFKRKVCYIFDYRDGAQPIPPFISEVDDPGRSWENAVMTYGTGTGQEAAGCKNNFFDTVYEIQKVTGINLGAGAAYDNPLDTLLELLEKRRGDESDMTVYSQDQNTQTDGSARIDINNTDSATLFAELSPLAPTLTLADCTEILNDTDYLEYGYPLVGNPDVYMGVGAVGWAADAEPANDPDPQDVISREEMLKIADNIKVVDPTTSITDPIIHGTVNINTATVYGLRGLFNINVDRAQAIINTRNNSCTCKGPDGEPSTGDDDNLGNIALPPYTGAARGTPAYFAHRGEITMVYDPAITGSSITKPYFQDHGDVVTVRSDRFRIYSTGEVGGAIRKIEAVVDRHYHDADPTVSGIVTGAFHTPGPIEVLYWSERVFED